MKKRIGCLHAHYSNIAYIEDILHPFNVELTHFVDPGLMYRVTSDEHFQTLEAETRVKEQIEWIAKCNVDAILITCTNYIAILPENQLSLSVPLIKMDEPFFHHLCKIEQPQMIIFSNPATVSGTLERLQEHVKRQNKSLDIETIVLENTFEILMQGKKEEYNREITNFLQKIVKNQKKVISVAQLSMVSAAQQVEIQTAEKIINPLNTLLSWMTKQLALEKR